MRLGKIILVIALLLTGFQTTSAQTAVANAKDQNRSVDYINPFIGTARKGSGGTMPCVNLPFAMTNFVAQTDQNKISRMPYVYDDHYIMGFLATHQPTVWMGDYGYVSVMPEVGSLKVLPEKRKLPFSHKQETAHPYYYSVILNPDKPHRIKAEMSATEHAGILTFIFPKSNDAHIVIQAINLRNDGDKTNSSTNRYKHFSAYVRIDRKNNEIIGYNPDRMSYNIGPKLKNFKGYFVIKFNKPFQSFGTWDEDSVFASSRKKMGKRMGAYVNFKTRKGEKISVKIGTSFISIDQARDNLHREIPDWDLHKVALLTKSKWQKALDRIKISGVSNQIKTIFYTAMFHTMLFPRKFSEYGRYYSAFDDTVHNGVSYNDYSLWDTFRAEQPLLLFTQPGRVDDMIMSLLQMYKHGGWMPKWPNPTYSNIMIGTHADAVIADAFVKGFRGYNLQTAYAAMRKDAMVPPKGDTHKRWGDRYPWTSYEARGGLTYFNSIGYVPVDKTNESVSRTLEFAYDDFCIAQVAKALGKMKAYKKLMKWSQNYHNVYNPQTGFMAPKLYNGKWDPKPNEGFTEGSKWTYLFCVMQDIPGMIKMMGGRKRFAAKVDSDFTGGHYVHDNEPDHHYTYLFDYCGEPWKTQSLVRKNTIANYHDRPSGINGNDDCGQMSAWYIFSSLGFYPVTPGTDVFAIGAPQYPKVTMQLGPDDNTHSFTIIAKNLSEKNKYVQSVALDGKPINHPFIHYQQIMHAKKLVFVMGDKPNYNWK